MHLAFTGTSATLLSFCRLADAYLGNVWKPVIVKVLLRSAGYAVDIIQCVHFCADF